MVSVFISNVNDNDDVPSIVIYVDDDNNHSDVFEVPSKNRYVYLPALNPINESTAESLILDFNCV